MLGFLAAKCTTAVLIGKTQPTNISVAHSGLLSPVAEANQKTTELHLNLVFINCYARTAETAIISRLSRTSGPDRAKVTIFGSGFGQSQGASRISFNGRSALVNSWSDSVIEVRVPPDETTGNVMVTVGGISSNPFNFKVVEEDFEKNCTRAKDRCGDRDRGSEALLPGLTGSSRTVERCNNAISIILVNSAKS